MNAILMIVTVFSSVFGNSVKNRFAKKDLKTGSDNLLFNLVGNALCIFIMAAAGGIGAVHSSTVLLSALFGLMNLLAGITMTTALHKGPMSLTSLIVLGGSLIFSTVAGTLCFSESVTALQAVGVVLVLISMILISNAKVEGNISPSWFAVVVLSAVFNGMLGVVQKMQSASAWPAEQMQFLFWTFVFCTGFNLAGLLLAGKTGKKEPVKKDTVTISMKGGMLLAALIVGATMAAQHIINLKLVAVLPSAVFFPICSGSRILLTALVDIVIFREKLSRRQVLSFILGFAAIMMLAGVFG